MTTVFRPRTLVLFAGDIFSFALALWLTLALRTLEFPSQETLIEHVIPFSLLFAVWVLVFFVAGLYESRSVLLERRALSTTLLVAQTINIVIAALFFFFVPLFGIAPKTILFIYLLVSLALVLFWRAVLFPLLGVQKPEGAIVVGEGPQIEELVQVLRAARHAPVHIEGVIAPSSALSLEGAVRDAIRARQPHFIIADWGDERVAHAFPGLYNYLTRGMRFIDASSLYEDAFGKISLTHVDERWIARHISRYAHVLYDPLKRAIDIFVALLGGVLSLALYPFIAVAIMLEDGGPVFVALERVGEGGAVMRMYKFRSMTGNDGGDYGESGRSNLSVTRVGRVLRRTRLDELPQLWNVLRGDLSLVGPRPETPALVGQYEKEIPHYTLRHLIKPGLSGSAQLYYHGDPHHAADVAATREKLSYDLFYLKHRSLTLDLSIGLKTVRRLFMRSNA